MKKCPYADVCDLMGCMNLGDDVCKTDDRFWELEDDSLPEEREYLRHTSGLSSESSELCWSDGGWSS